MGERLGLSVGATNLVAARPDGFATVRPAAVTWRGMTLSGFTDRIGDPVPIVAPDGSAHDADRLLSEALADLARGVGRPDAGRTWVAVPAHWRADVVDRVRALLPDEVVTSDAVSALTALRHHPGLPSRGVVVLCDFGATGTTISLADAAAGFAPVGDAVRDHDFSGDMIDRSVLAHLLAGLESDPSATSAVASLGRFRENCRIAKERLSAQAATGLAGPQPGATVRITRTDLETLLADPLDGFVATLDDVLRRTGVRRSDLCAVATVGGGARIPMLTQRLSEVLRMPVTTTPHSQIIAAVGAALMSGREAEASTRMAVAVPAPSQQTPLPLPQPVPEALAWSQEDGHAESGSEPDFGEFEHGDLEHGDLEGARPDLTFDHVDADEHRAPPPLSWYQRPALVFAAAACAAVVAAVGLVVTADTEAATASSALTPSTLQPAPPVADQPVAAGPIAPAPVARTVVAPRGTTVVRYAQAPVPRPQAPVAARRPAPQAPPPVIARPPTTTGPTSTTTSAAPPATTTTTTAPTTTPPTTTTVPPTSTMPPTSTAPPATTVQPTPPPTSTPAQTAAPVPTPTSAPIPTPAPSSAETADPPATTTPQVPEA